VVLHPAGDALLGACMNTKETNLHWKKTRAAWIHRPIYTQQRIICQRAMCILCTHCVFPRPAEDAILGAGPMMIFTYLSSKDTCLIRSHRVILKIHCWRCYARPRTYNDSHLSILKRDICNTHRVCLHPAGDDILGAGRIMITTHRFSKKTYVTHTHCVILKLL